MKKQLASLIRWIVGRYKMYESGFYMLITAISFPTLIFVIERNMNNWLAYFVLAVGVFSMIMAIYTLRQEHKRDYKEKKFNFDNTEERATEIKILMIEIINSMDKLVNEIRQDRNERRNKKD